MSDSNDWMTYRSGVKSSEELSRQSSGRELTAKEKDFAAALEAVFADGIHDFEAVAGELTRRGIAAPSSGQTEWNLNGLVAELKAINHDLDRVYSERGFGA